MVKFIKKLSKRHWKISNSPTGLAQTISPSLKEAIVSSLTNLNVDGIRIDERGFWEDIHDWSIRKRIDLSIYAQPYSPIFNSLKHAANNFPSDQRTSYGAQQSSTYSSTGPSSASFRSPNSEIKTVEIQLPKVYKQNNASSNPTLKTIKPINLKNKPSVVKPIIRPVSKAINTKEKADEVLLAQSKFEPFSNQEKLAPKPAVKKQSVKKVQVIKRVIETPELTPKEKPVISDQVAPEINPVQTPANTLFDLPSNFSQSTNLVESLLRNFNSLHRKPVISHFLIPKMRQPVMKNSEELEFLLSQWEEEKKKQPLKTPENTISNSEVYESDIDIKIAPPQLPPIFSVRNQEILEKLLEKTKSLFNKSILQVEDITEADHLIAREILDSQILSEDFHWKETLGQNIDKHLYNVFIDGVELGTQYKWADYSLVTKPIYELYQTQNEIILDDQHFSQERSRNAKRILPTDRFQYSEISLVSGPFLSDFKIPFGYQLSVNGVELEYLDKYKNLLPIKNAIHTHFTPIDPSLLVKPIYLPEIILQTGPIKSNYKIPFGYGILVDGVNLSLIDRYPNIWPVTHPIYKNLKPTRVLEPILDPSSEIVIDSTIFDSPLIKLKSGALYFDYQIPFGYKANIDGVRIALIDKFKNIYPVKNPIWVSVEKAIFKASRPIPKSDIIVLKKGPIHSGYQIPFGYKIAVDGVSLQLWDKYKNVMPLRKPVYKYAQLANCELISIPFGPQVTDYSIPDNYLNQVDGVTQSLISKTITYFDNQYSIFNSYKDNLITFRNPILKRGTIEHDHILDDRYNYEIDGISPRPHLRIPDNSKVRKAIYLTVDEFLEIKIVLIKLPAGPKPHTHQIPLHAYQEVDGVNLSQSQRISDFRPVDNAIYSQAQTIPYFEEVSLQRGPIYFNYDIPWMHSAEVDGVTQHLRLPIKGRLSIKRPVYTFAHLMPPKLEDIALKKGAIPSTSLIPYGKQREVDGISCLLRSSFEKTRPVSSPIYILTYLETTITRETIKYDYSELESKREFIYWVDGVDILWFKQKGLDIPLKKPVYVVWEKYMKERNLVLNNEPITYDSLSYLEKEQFSDQEYIFSKKKNDWFDASPLVIFRTKNMAHLKNRTVLVETNKYANINYIVKRKIDIPSEKIHSNWTILAASLITLFLIFAILFNTAIIPIPFIVNQFLFYYPVIFWTPVAVAIWSMIYLYLIIFLQKVRLDRLNKHVRWIRFFSEKNNKRLTHANIWISIIGALGALGGLVFWANELFGSSVIEDLRIYRTSTLFIVLSMFVVGLSNILFALVLCWRVKSLYGFNARYKEVLYHLAYDIFKLLESREWISETRRFARDLWSPEIIKIIELRNEKLKEDKFKLDKFTRKEVVPILFEKYAQFQKFAKEHPNFDLEKSYYYRMAIDFNIYASSHPLSIKSFDSNNI